MNPNNARARAEIARAYFALGETRAARQEFETVKQQGIPPGVQQTIDKFLSAVERLDAEGQTTIRGFVEATTGYDTNPNASTASSQVAVPALGGSLLTLNNTKQSDAFNSVAAGVNLRKPIDPRLAFLAGLSGTKRVNEKLDRVNTGSWDANAGLVYKEEKDVFSISLQAAGVFVDDQRYRDTWGLSGQWQHNYDQRNQATLFLQYADLRYPLGAQLFNGKKRDAERWIAGAGFAHALRDQRTVLFASLYAGFEDTRSQPTAELDYRTWGLRGGGQYQISDVLSVFANGSYENRHYLGRDGFFLVNRDDENFNAGIGMTWSPAKNWKVTPQWQHSTTRSNIAINTYDRDVLSVSARFDF